MDRHSWKNIDVLIVSGRVGWPQRRFLGREGSSGSPRIEGVGPCRFCGVEERDQGGRRRVSSGGGGGGGDAGFCGGGRSLRDRAVRRNIVMRIGEGSIGN